MTFAQKLKKLIDELGITQRSVSEMTGISASSVSQYLSGKNEPQRKRKREMALALGVDENYFDDFMPKAEIKNDSPIKMTTKLAAQLMHKSERFIRIGLQEGRFPWGYAVQTSPNKWTYFISVKKFTEFTGIEVPIN